MLAPIPYFDVAGYKRRSKINPNDLDIFVSAYPGYIEHRTARGSSLINARLAKRYIVPLGQEAPLLVAAGTHPPAVVLTGRPTLGDLEMAIQITTGGALGVAVFRWSEDGGESWTSGVTTAATVSLGDTGLVAAFSVGTYATDNAYDAATPVPEIALGWLASLLDVDVWQRRGTNPQDPALVMALDDRNESLSEIKEAADSKEALFELPSNDAVGGSAIEHGGPLMYTEASPFVGADLQQAQGMIEDEAGRGTYGGN